MRDFLKYQIRYLTLLTVLTTGFATSCSIKSGVVSGQRGEQYLVGYQQIADYLPKGSYTGRFWYPISSDVEVSPVSTAPLFRSFLGSRGAAAIERPRLLPLLVLSHGSGSMAVRLDWMAHYFARRGWLVVGINHPGNTFGDNSAEGLMQVWRRAQQVTDLLNYLLKREPFASRVNRQQIVVAGHSAGGTTALLLAGARLNKKNLENPVPHCMAKPEEFDDERCGDLKKIDISKYSQQVVERNYTDQRIKAAIAMDPGFARSFRPVGSQRLPTPTLILLAQKLKSSEGEIYAKKLPELFPMAQSQIVPGTIHISFVTPCSARGFKMKAPICLGDVDRSALQKDINERSLKFLHGVFDG